MATGYPSARQHGSLDPDTPVVSLGDKHQYRRETVVLLSDEERDLASEVVGRMRAMRERGVIQGEQKAWHETVFGRLAVVAGLVAAIADLVATLYAVSTH